MNEVFIIQNGKKRSGIELVCNHCNCKYLTRKGWINRSKFCSQTCAKLNKTHEKETLTCSQCGKIFKRIKNKLKNSKSGMYFCQRSCKDQAQRLGGIKEIMPPHYGTGGGTYRSKFSESELVCRRCGYNEFPCSVEIHHIDKNRDNNAIENLVPLCANCHAGIHQDMWKIEEVGLVGVAPTTSRISV